jgi:hypothetical protein
MSKLGFLKKINKNSLLIAVAVLGIAITGAVIFLNGNQGQISLAGLGFGLSDKTIAQKSVDYINNNQLSSEPATLVSFFSESGVVRVKIKIGANEFDSYATKDGKLLFAQAIKLDEKIGGTSETNTKPTAEQIKQACDGLTKTDVPVLEAYVVSKCPFGLQMQRVMADAIQKVPSMAQYLKVRYMGSIVDNKVTAMHGDAEAQENLRQICLRDEQSNKYWGYISCHIKKGDTTSCEKTAGVDSAKLTACTTDANRGVAYAKIDFDLSTKYSVKGSPTLILNEAQVSESSFGGRSSDVAKNIICCASKNQPSFCSTALDTAEAASSFSETYAGAGNSGAAGTNCAPAQ